MFRILFHIQPEPLLLETHPITLVGQRIREVRRLTKGPEMQNACNMPAAQALAC